MAYRIVLRQDTAANWISNNPTLLSGEFGFETNTNSLKLGNGIDAWTSLEYFQGPTGATGATGAAAATGATGPLDWSTAPATGGSTGSTGQIAYDYSGLTGHFYVCVDQNTWLRTQLTTF
jgi:hypothetical protein